MLGAFRKISGCFFIAINKKRGGEDMATKLDELQVVIAGETSDIRKQFKEIIYTLKCSKEQVDKLAQEISHGFSDIVNNVSKQTEIATKNVNKSFSGITENAAKSAKKTVKNINISLIPENVAKSTNKISKNVKRSVSDTASSIKKSTDRIAKDVENNTEKTVNSVAKSTAKLSKGLKDSVSGSGFGGKNGIVSGISGSVMGLSVGIGAAVAAIGAIVSALKSALRAASNFGKECLELGSDLAEVQNVVDVTFGNMSSKVDKFAKDAIASYGLSETVAKKYMGTFGAMNKAFGFSTEKSYEMAEAVTKLTGDVASFYNLSSDMAYTKLKSIWTGETESLKDLGVVMTQAALDQYALANGYNKTTKQMSESEKVMLRYAFVQDKLSASSGDFMRTSDGWANQVRVLSLRFDSLKASIGQALIPMLTPVVQMLNTLIGKIQMAVEWFNKLISAFTGKENSVSSAGAVTVEAASAVGSIGENAQESADDTVKAAKKIKNALAGIDEINVLKFGDDSADSDDNAADVGGMGSVIDESTADKTDTVLDKMAEKIKGFIDKIRAEFERLKKIFNEGFTVGLGGGSINFEDMQPIFDRIRNGLKGIFGDGSVFDAYKEFIDKMIFGIGEMAGAFTSIGNTIAINLFGGMGKYLEQNAEYIKERLTSIYESWGGIFEQLGKFSAAVADVFSVFRGDDAQQITSDIIAIFGNAYLGITDLFSKLAEDTLKLLTQPFIDNVDDIKKALEDTLPAIRNITGTLRDYVTNTFSKIFEVYEKYIKPAFENFENGLDRITKTFVKAWSRDIAPVLERVTSKINEFFKKHVQPITDKIIVILGILAEKSSEIFRDTIAPILSALIDKYFPELASNFETAVNIIIDILGVVCDEIENTLDNIIYLLSGGFAEDLARVIVGLNNIISGKLDDIKSYFSQIWTGIKDTFYSIWESIKQIAKSGINSVIDSFNGFKINIPAEVRTTIKAIGGVSLPDKIGFNIPKLARGGIVDSPTLAMIGESGREAVVPLQNNTQGLDMLASLIEGKMGAEQPINIELTLNVGGDKVADSVVKQINRMTKAAGRTVIDIV
jgi:hypothetical protein